MRELLLLGLLRSPIGGAKAKCLLLLLELLLHELILADSVLTWLHVTGRPVAVAKNKLDIEGKPY